MKSCVSWKSANALELSMCSSPVPARTGSGWTPAAVSEDQVAEVLDFVKAAERVGEADPEEVDDYLRRGSAALLRKDYSAARRIFGALLSPIGDGSIDLGGSGPAARDEAPHTRATQRLTEALEEMPSGDFVVWGQRKAGPTRFR